MGLFDKLKGKTEKVDWSEAFKATPMFCSKPGEESFCAVTLTEEVATILPKAPREMYLVKGKVVPKWRMMLVSISRDCVIGETDYFSALKKAKKYILDSDEDHVLIRGLSLEELESLKE